MNSIDVCKLYARKNNDCYEYLVDHLTTTSILSYTLYKALKRLYKPRYVVYSLIAGLLHDIGKAYLGFQRDKEKRSLSFKYHELLSYAIVSSIESSLRKSIKELFNINASLSMVEYESFILRPIVFHHQGLRGITIIGEREAQRFIDKINRSKENINVIEKVIQESAYRTINILSTLGYTEKEVFHILKSLTNIQMERIDIIRPGGGIVKDEEVVEESRTITGLLMLADNLATAINMPLPCVEQRLITLEAAYVVRTILYDKSANLPKEWCNKVEAVIEQWLQGKETAVPTSAPSS